MLQAEQVAAEAVAKQTRTIAICGTAGSSRDEILKQPDDVELWGLNLSYKWMPRCDRWFEMHDPNIFTGIFAGEHREWLRTTTVPVYMQRRLDEFPTSIAFPVDAVTEGGQYHPYLTSSIAYMIALAVHEQVSEIRLLGVNLATGSEYQYQRAAAEYWCGVALARGIKVYVPPSCPLFKGPRYGAVGVSADMARAIVDKREATKFQMEREIAEFLDKLRTDYLLKSDNLEDRRSELHDALHALDQVRYACLGGIQVLDQLTEGQVALTADQSGLQSVEGI